MKAQIILTTILLFTAAGRIPASERRLVGCRDPISIASNLETLQQNNWKELSVKDVLSIWPSRFDELNCESEPGCRLLVSKDRVIAGHCECCEAFTFDVEMNGDGSRSESLNQIVFHYSSRDKRQVIDAAKRLAAGAGLAGDRVALIGEKSIERYEWPDTRESVPQSYIMELQFNKVGHNWELYLSLGAVPL
jgi:hypothetical protein